MSEREELLAKAAQDFIDKVDRGAARSEQSYAAFKVALAAPQALAATPAVPVRLEAWIRENFAGHGRALRRETDAPLEGEPWMSMDEAKELTRQAVALFGRAATPAVGGAYEMALADKLVKLCCAETEKKFFDCVTDNIVCIIDSLRAKPGEREALQRAYDFLQDKSFTPDALTHECTKVLEQIEAALAALPASPLRRRESDNPLRAYSVEQLQFELAIRATWKSASPPEQPAADPERDSIFDMCVMIVEEECYLDDPNGPIFKTGLAIRDRIKCAQRNRDKET